jgi:hypothetical protein
MAEKNIEREIANLKTEEIPEEILDLTPYPTVKLLLSVFLALSASFFAPVSIVFASSNQLLAVEFVEVLRGKFAEKHFC